MPEKAGCSGDDSLRLAFREDERFGFGYAWEPETRPRGDAFRSTRAPPPQLLKRLDEQFAARALRLILRKLADGEVRLLLAGTRLTESYAPHLHHCVAVAGAPVLLRTSHKTASFASVKDTSSLRTAAGSRRFCFRILITG